MSYKIITDTAADISKEYLEKYNIEALPLSVVFGDESYLDGVDIKNDEFFDRLINGNIHPTTSCVSSNAFLESFERNLKEYDEIIYVGVSSVLSATFQSSVIAKQELDTDRITILDSKNVTCSEGLIVLLFAKMYDGVMDKEKLLNSIIDRVNSYYVVDTLTYLKKGGRISSTKATIGNLINMKPIITVKDGKLESLYNARGKKKAYKKVLDSLLVSYPDRQIDYCAFCHSANSDIEDFIKYITENFTIGETFTFEVGSVVGTHSGPGCVGLATL